MKTAKIIAIVNNSNPINEWVQGFELVTSDGYKKTFTHRHEAKAFAKKHSYKVV